MAGCPKCATKLSKKKSDMSWNCRLHGRVRYINSPSISESVLNNRGEGYNEVRPIL